MRADALAQYLIWKKWPRWFVLKGVAPSDKDYDAAVERAAGRFGGKIVEEREYKFDTANPRTDSGHQQIQTQMPELTQGAPEHDVVWVVDTIERFGEYVPLSRLRPKARGRHARPDRRRLAPLLRAICRHADAAPVRALRQAHHDRARLFGVDRRARRSAKR